MTREEWLIEFQVLNGRMPTEQEVAEAAQKGFATAAVQTTTNGAKRDNSLFLKIAVGFVVAIFGYVVGYLFM